MTFSLDVKGADALAASFIEAKQSIKKDARAVVSHGALNVKKQMQTELRTSPHFKAVAQAVTYDLTDTEAEIGPEIGKGAGSLAWIAAFGTGRTPAWWDFTKAARDEAPNLEKFLLDAAEKAL